MSSVSDNSSKKTFESKLTLDFYFDFVSPISHLASVEIKKLADKHNLTLKWNVLLPDHSILFDEHKKIKNHYLEHNLSRHVDLQKIEMKRNFSDSTVNALAAARCFSLLENDIAINFAKKCMSVYWQDNRDILNDVDSVIAIAISVGGHHEILEGSFLRGDAKDSLDRSLAHSAQSGVSSSPTFILNDKMFIGIYSIESIDLKLKANKFI